MNKFKVGEEVMVFSTYKAKIFGVADVADCSGEKYAVSYIDKDDRKLNAIVREDQLSKMKKPDELQPGDRFRTEFKNTYTVKAKHKQDEKVHYFVVNEDGQCFVLQEHRVHEIIQGEDKCE